MADLRIAGRSLRTRVHLTTAALGVGVAACLAIDAYVHLSDAPDYAAVRTSVLSEAMLFRVEGVVAAVVAAALLLRPRPLVWAAAATTLAAGLAAVLVYTYVDVGRVGPLPDMYEPSWVLPGKTLSAWAEGIGAVLALAGLAVVTSTRGRQAPSKITGS